MPQRPENVDHLASRIPLELNSQLLLVRHLAKSGQSHPILVKCEREVPAWPDLRKGTEYFLKVLKADASDYARERFRREIQALQAIKHVNVIFPVAASAPAANEPWLLLPKGLPFKETWRAFRSSNGNEPSRVFNAALQHWECVLSGLKALHAAGWVHRDVKPENLLLLGEDIKVIDLGVGFNISQDQPRLTQEDGRAVQNRLVRVVPALYDLTVVPEPWFDCLGAVLLLAWLLADDPTAAYGHYHWKHHVFVDDERCEAVRYLLALVSDDSTVPRSIDALCGVLSSYIPMLLQIEGTPLAEHTNEVTRAAAAARQARLQRETAKQARLLLASSTAPIAADFVLPMLLTMAKLTTELEQAMDTHISFSFKVAAGTSSSSPLTKDVVTKRLIYNSERQEHSNQAILEVRCTSLAGRHSSVDVMVRFEEIGEADEGWALPYRLEIHSYQSGFAAVALPPGTPNTIPASDRFSGRLRTDLHLQVGARKWTASEVFEEKLKPFLIDPTFWGEQGY